MCCFVLVAVVVVGSQNSHGIVMVLVYPNMYLTLIFFLLFKRGVGEEQFFFYYFSVASGTTVLFIIIFVLMINFIVL